jgi:hypothetical protein
MGAFDANFGPASKKPPPLRGGGDVTCGAATEERWFAGLLKPAKGSDLVCCCGLGAGGDDTGGLKFRLLKASSRPPKLELD